MKTNPLSIPTLSFVILFFYFMLLSNCKNSSNFKESTFERVDSLNILTLDCLKNSHPDSCLKLIEESLKIPESINYNEGKGVAIKLNHYGLKVHRLV